MKLEQRISKLESNDSAGSLPKFIYRLDVTASGEMKPEPVSVNLVSIGLKYTPRRHGNRRCSTIRAQCFDLLEPV